MPKLSLMEGSGNRGFTGSFTEPKLHNTILNSVSSVSVTYHCFLQLSICNNFCNRKGLVHAHDHRGFYHRFDESKRGHHCARRAPCIFVGPLAPNQLRALSKTSHLGDLDIYSRGFVAMPVLSPLGTLLWQGVMLPFCSLPAIGTPLQQGICCHFHSSLLWRYIIDYVAMSVLPTLGSTIRHEPCSHFCSYPH